MTFKNLSKTTLFLLLTVVLSLSMVGGFLGLGGKFEGIAGTLLAAAYMFVLMLAGFIALAVFLLGLFIYDTWISKERLMSSKIESYLQQGIKLSEEAVQAKKISCDIRMFIAQASY